MTANQPERVPDLLAYLIQIVKASLDFDGPTWATYDDTFCRQAATTGRYPVVKVECFLCVSQEKPGVSTSVNGTSVQTMKQRGTLYHKNFPATLQQDGQANAAGGGQANEDRQMSGGPLAWPICRRFNATCCKDRTCRYRHICMRWQGLHPAIDCGSQRSTGKAGFKTRQNHYYPY